MIRVVEDGTIFCITSSCLALVAVLFCTVPRKISTQSFFFLCMYVSSACVRRSTAFEKLLTLTSTFPR